MQSGCAWKRESIDLYIRSAIPKNASKIPYNITSILNNLKSILKQVFEKGEAINMKKYQNIYCTNLLLLKEKEPIDI